MNLLDYLNYPMGKGNSTSMLPTVKREMISRYEKEGTGMKIAWYKINHKALYAHVQIPSLKTAGLLYDVVFEFPYNKEDLNRGNNIFSSPFKVYSNSPSFTYTYSYIFNRHGLLCDWAKKLYSKEVLTKEPSSRNQFGIIFYEKSIFFTAYHITQNFNVSITKLDEIAESSSIHKIIEFVQSEKSIKQSSFELREAARQSKLNETKLNEVTEKGLKDNGEKPNRMMPFFPKNGKIINTQKAKSAVKAKKPSGLKGTKKI